MKLLLSTGNIMGAGSPIVRPGTKTNTEFVESLRANFEAHALNEAPETNGQSNGNGATAVAHFESWTTRKGDTLEIPTLDFANSTLQEEREQYDITLKLFFLPGADIQKRNQQTREALELVLKELGMPSADLFIVSFPGIYFDEEEDCPNKISTRGPVEADPEPLDAHVQAWKTLEQLYGEGLIKKLGIAELGYERLLSFLDRTTLRPSVDQINLRDCCSVPKNLMALAKSRNVELLVHNDCSNVLPRGTVRELLGPEPKGAGVLVEPSKVGEKRKEPHDQDIKQPNSGPLSGDVQPQWVVKYTAVVKNRGVVEHKGYFASAELTT